MAKSLSTAKVKKLYREAWCQSQMARGMLDGQIVDEGMKKFSVSESVMRAALKSAYKRLFEIEGENLAEKKIKVLANAYSLLDTMRETLQLGAAASHFKTIAQLEGVLQDPKTPVVVNVAPQPETEVVRARIAELMKNPEIKERAKKLGLNLDDSEKNPSDGDV